MCPDDESKLSGLQPVGEVEVSRELDTDAPEEESEETIIGEKGSASTTVKNRSYKLSGVFSLICLLLCSASFVWLSLSCHEKIPNEAKTSMFRAQWRGVAIDPVHNIPHNAQLGFSNWDLFLEEQMELQSEVVKAISDHDRGGEKWTAIRFRLLDISKPYLQRCTHMYHRIINFFDVTRSAGGNSVDCVDVLLSKNSVELAPEKNSENSVSFPWIAKSEQNDAEGVQRVIKMPAKPNIDQIVHIGERIGEKIMKKIPERISAVTNQVFHGTGESLRSEEEKN